MLLLVVETSCSSELNSFDNSSAVARDALKSSFMDWTAGKKTKKKRKAAESQHQLASTKTLRRKDQMKQLTQHAAAITCLGAHGCDAAATSS